MFTPQEIHHGILLPIFLSLVLLLPALIPKLRAHGPIVLLASLTLALVFPHLHLFGRPPLPPVEAQHWLFYFAPMGCSFALLIHLTKMRWLALPVFFGSTMLMLWRLLRNDHSFAESATIVTAIALASFISYLSLTELAPRAGSRSMHIIMLLLLAATSQVIFMSGSKTLGQLSLIVAASLLGSLVVALPLKISLAHGPLLLIVLLWHALLICAHFTATLTPLNALLLAAAPHLAWIAEAPKTRLWRTSYRVILRFAAVLIPMLTAQIIARLDFIESTRDFQY